MPSKVNFFVIGSTGAEDNFDPQSLESPSPLSKGWKTPRFCPYPQQLTVQLSLRAARIRKIQILSHQNMIPTRIEVAVAAPQPASRLNADGGAWKKLGFVSFSSNSQTGYKQRELKSILLDVVVGYVRLKVHQNHINHLNLFNQVGIVAFNILGDDVSHAIPPSQSPTTDLSHGLSSTYEPSHQYGGYSNGRSSLDPEQTNAAVQDVINFYLPQSVSGLHSTTNPQLWGSINQPTAPTSITDDLAFGVYQDPKIAELIKKLEEKKEKAVTAELYQHAKLIKQAIEELQQFGERMGRLEAEKIKAVESEDYDTAMMKKVEKEEVSVQAMECLQAHRIVTNNPLTQQQRVAEESQNVSPPQQDALPLPSQEVDDLPAGYEAHEPFRMKPIRLATPPDLPHFAPAGGVQGSLPTLYEPRYSNAAAAAAALSRPAPEESTLSRGSHEGDRRGSVPGRSSMAMMASASPPLSHRQPVSESPPRQRVSKQETPPRKQSLVQQQRQAASHDDQPIPTTLPPISQPNTLTTSKENMGELPAGGGKNDQSLQALSAKVAVQYSTPINVFSQEIVQMVLSKNFSQRSDGLCRATQLLLDTNHPLSAAHSLATIERAVVQILSATMKDRVFGVFQDSTSFFMHALDTISSSKSDIAHLAAKGFAMLLPRVGDQAPRVASHSREVVIQLSVSPIVKPLNIICPAAMEPLSQSHQSIWQQYRGRIDLLGDLFNQDSLKTGLTVSGMMKFMNPALEHRRGPVRDAATKLIIALYKKFGQEVRKHLPPDNAANRKKPFFKNIFTEFDRIDGKPSKDDLKAKADAEEQAKLDQVRQLQEQMKMLQALQRGEIPVEAEESPPRPSNPKKKPSRPVAAKVETPPPGPPKPKPSQIPKRGTPQAGSKASKGGPNQTRLQRNDAKKDRISRCIFCEAKHNEGEAEQEKHYCSQCPMLTSCPGCTQVVEVSNLSGHLLSECPDHASFKKCQRCKQAVAAVDMEQHTTLNACPKFMSGMTCCPLCTGAIHDNDKSWRYHLMQVCATNPRREVNPAVNKRVAALAGSSVPHSRPPSYAPTIPGTTGAHLATSPGNRSTSRIPTLAARSPRVQR